MAGLTSSGLVIKTLPEIYSSMGDKLKLRYGSSFSMATNTPEGVIIGTVSDELDELWQVALSVWDNLNPKTASGVSLDNVADRVGVKRIPAANSTAVLEVTGTVGIVVPTDTAVKVEDTETRFFTSSALTLSSTQFSDITLNITAVVDSTNYSVTINNTTVIVNSGVSATAASILTLLKAGIDASVSGVTTSSPTSTTLRVNVTEINSVFPLTLGARIGVTSVSDLVTVVAEFEGYVEAPANTLNSLLVPISGITSVNNVLDATTGRLKETDNELRIRRYESVGNIGASTQTAITSNLRSLDGVTSAFLVENAEYVVDVDGRPPKSFEAIVEGGDEDEIAQTILDFKPEGIESYGDITRTVLDLDGNAQAISFSRPITLYVRVEVDYTKYSEEAFSASGEDAIKQSVLAYGETLNIGKDVIPKRFYGTIYSNVDGVEDVVIRMSYSLDEITWSPYSTSPIAVNRKQRSNFDLTRITVTEV